ncbi:MAG: methionine biosynthesis protein MetW [Candidatus Margulisiibacteriota bacterium]|nr:MAG: methionine biosynthesis protein MetW [Candidatus Margulisbacteria bacterium GWD2_39_127]OGI03244.1 MAG: methionine biosynthesis protein MetW [Candidatus Margulisbacteria bacterium GWF2_38_17]OGI11267.1 MAG: methionine biosynthesis protein MetW [Candidatus Margulisbacteria bacterium GWE2_39_32]PZM78512.1 MAG: methionine biosynthesis protein MetW [Candidatus Margulisiibacteriota bacterium]HAR63923.1 methionine biosynthesis protein MetW [Candidatus Margulisiibacteriota bacterium]
MYHFQGIYHEPSHKRLDLQIIVDLIEEGSKVLDIGCGDGDLLALLKKEKKITAYGIEILDEKIGNCVSKGLTVFQGNIDEGLCDYGNGCFDYVILSQTLQVVMKTEFVINEILRVGKKAIISFPNFGFWKCRWDLLITGRSPKTKSLPFEWYDTPNTRILTIKDFRAFCEEKNIAIIKEIPLLGTKTQGKVVAMLPNWRAHYGMFIISKD